jgi:hypothetical protein
MLPDEIGELLGRSESAVKVRAARLKIRRTSSRRWKHDEERFVRANYRNMTAEQMAARLGRSVSSVHNFLQTRGLKKAPHVIDHRKLAAFLRAKHKRGWSDGEISAAWTAAHPDQPISREWLSDVRRNKLRLPNNAYNDRYSRRVAATTRQQLERAGLDSLGDVRARAFQERAVAAGWPPYCRPREVQILDLLYDHGPKTRRQIVEAIHATLHDDQRKWLACTTIGNGNYPRPRGSYVANLVAYGLVVQLGRKMPSGPGRGQHCQVYAIAPGIVRGRFEPFHRKGAMKPCRSKRAG